MPTFKKVNSLSLLIVLLSAFSCKKDQTAVQQYIVPTYSAISVTNAAVGSGSLSFFLDNQQVQLPDSLSYGTTAFFNVANNPNPSNPLTGSTPYENVSYGYRQLGFGFPNTPSYLASMKNYFEPGAYYSVFIADTIEYGQLQCILMKDDLTFLDSGKAQIRFVNLSPDAPGMDLWAFPDANTSAGYQLFSNRVFPVYNYGAVLESQQFSTINSGPYYFAAIQTGTSNVLLQGGLIVPNKSVVTIYAKGLLLGTGEKQLDVGVIEYSR
jgi:Domain of unknown function (DUF4397)